MSKIHLMERLTKASDEIKSINPINNVKQSLYDVTVDSSDKKSIKSPEQPKEEVTFKKKETNTTKEND